ncbi:MAG: type I-F CRISPR-associated helicase Cas3f, partial [Psittacicella sp.]
MFVIFTSKSTKGAIKSTYRILDNYAIRIGANTWKTAITMDGLNSVNKELKKAASRSKNLAVSCHLIKKRTSKVIWTIGKKGIFHENGAIAVHIKKISKKDFLMKNSEDQWPYVEIIKISAGIGALLHDLGKSTKGFQKKLTTISKSGDPLRHEWISLKLFEILIKDCNTDEKWLERFKEFDTPNSYLNNFTKKTSYENLINSIPLNELKSINLNSFPPYARFIAYLIYSHHRLPGLENREWDSLYFTDKERENYKKVDYPRSKLSLESYYNNLFQAMNHWVINPYKDSEIKEFFKFTNFVTNSKAWQKEISKYTKKALNSEILYPELNKAKESLKGEKEYINIFDNPIILKLTRLCLMVGDYSFSSMPKDPKSDDNPKFLKNLKANTIFQEKTTKQYLDEHLLGVKNYAVEMAHLLPYLNTHLPRLEVEYTSSFAKKTPNENFKWQNIAFNEVQKQAKTIKKEGFFGVNIASTGSGKTVANARVMYAMSNKQDGVRFTIALGLRTLTIQTGQSIRDILDLNENELKTLVGGSYDSNSKEHSDIEKDEIKNKIFTNGSESSEELFNGFMDYNYSSYSYDTSNYNLEIFQKLFNTSNDGKKSADLLLSPILVCTIDHLMNASECKRGGKYIIPLLRILTSDLVLDEPDDFDMNDLPALTRLVHLVGMFGSNILLSSATMTTDMIAGLFKAYEAGRLIYNQMNNQPTTNIVCGLFS